MAYIDMKQCTFLVEDGYTKTGAVNNMAGYAAAATTLTVDSFGASVELEVGILIKFAGHDNYYKVVSQTPTSGTTTSIVITPGLAEAVVDNEVITAGPHAIAVTIGDGNCTWDEKRNLEYKLNRGKLDKVRLGDEVGMDVNLAFSFEFITSKSGATTPTVEEFLKQEGPAAAYVTTSADPCEPYSVNLVIIQNQATCGNEDEPVEKIVLPYFRYTSLNHDPKAGTVTVQGTCNATKAIRTRHATAEDALFS